jgi:hypothetical protein
MTPTDEDPLSDTPTVVDAQKLEKARRQSASDIDTSTFDADVVRRRLHSLSGAPRLARPMSELRDAIDDTQTAYVYAFVDGILPVQSIVTLAGLPEADTLRILHKGLADGTLLVTSKK